MKNQRIRNRRGAAVELAIVALLLIFAICTMIADVCLLSRQRNREAIKDKKYDVEARALGEEFFAVVCEQRAVFNYANAEALFPDLVVTTDYIPGKERVSVEIGQRKERDIAYVRHLLTVKVEVEFTEEGQVTRIVEWSYMKS